MIAITLIFKTRFVALCPPAQNLALQIAIKYPIKYLDKINGHVSFSLVIILLCLS